MRKRFVRVVLGALAAAVTVGTVSNVLLDNTEVSEQARRAACGISASCSYQKSSEMRTPWAQSFVFSGPKGPLEVSCYRAAIVLGEVHCSVSSAH